MDSLERDVLEVHALVRFLKNSLASINRIPPEVLSLIPDYFHEDYMDRGLITLTHVCRHWRGTFIFNSSLWTRLNFTDLDKILTYIERSKSSPLEFHVIDNQGSLDAFPLVMPHLHKLKRLTISAGLLPEVFKHFHCCAPLLEELDIEIVGPYEPDLDHKLFNGDLSSLRKLSLGKVRTDLPWRNMANLQVFVLTSLTPTNDVTQLLDFFESAPLLHTIRLQGSIPSLSNAPPKRIVLLSRLHTLCITADPIHSTLLNHLSIPAGASLIQEFEYRGQEFPLLDYLPETLANLRNLSDITALDLRFNILQKFITLTGPSGGLRILALWIEMAVSYNMDHWVLCSLPIFPLSRIQRLSVMGYGHPNLNDMDDHQVFQTLSLANNLRILVLTKCNNFSFIFALDPAENLTGLLLCPHLEELVLHIGLLDQLCTDALILMVKNRASIGVKLSSIVIIGLGEVALGEEALKLREHILNVEYRADGEQPDWESSLIDSDESD